MKTILSPFLEYGIIFFLVTLSIDSLLNKGQFSLDDPKQGICMEQTKSLTNSAATSPLLPRQVGENMVLVNSTVSNPLCRTHPQHPLFPALVCTL
jgi:hypothetical protein